MKRPFVIAALATLAVLAAADAARGQDRRGIVWDNRPSIVFGEDINIDIRGRVQLDWRAFDPDVDEDGFDVRTIRVGSSTLPSSGCCISSSSSSSSMRPR